MTGPVRSLLKWANPAANASYAKHAFVLKFTRLSDERVLCGLTYIHFGTFGERLRRFFKLGVAEIAGRSKSRGFNEDGPGGVTAYNLSIAMMGVNIMNRNVGMPKVATGSEDEAHLSKKVHSLEKLVEISQQVSTLDLRTTLETIMENILELTGTKRGVLMMLNEKGELRFEFAINIDRSEVDSEGFSFSRSSALRAIETGEAIVVEDVPSSSMADRPSIVGLGLMALMAIPLKARDTPLGVIYIDTDRPNHKMFTSDLSIFTAFGRQAAIAIQNAQSHKNLQDNYAFLKRSIEGNYGFDKIIYQSAAMHRVCESIKRVLDNDITVLITGETGTGKELVARAIHYNGKRREWRFLSQNAGALPDTILESELFGHVRGAFTGAVENKVGLFEEADGGTVFLDEIGEASTALQVRLLRLLETSTFRRVGEFKDRTTNARIVAATNRDLKSEAEAGNFRSDLYYRLSVYPIHLPPLRERKDDIPLLVRHLVAEFNIKLNKQVNQIGKQAMAALMDRDWLGNVRELKNFVYRMMVLSPSNELIDPDAVMALEHQERGVQPPVPVQRDDGPIRTLEEVEKEHIRFVLDRVDGNQARAARELGLNRSTFRWRLKKHGISP